MISIANRTRRLAGAALLAVGLSAGSIAATAVPARGRQLRRGLLQERPGRDVRRGPRRLGPGVLAGQLVHHLDRHPRCSDRLRVAAELRPTRTSAQVT